MKNRFLDIEFFPASSIDCCASSRTTLVISHIFYSFIGDCIRSVSRVTLLIFESKEIVIMKEIYNRTEFVLDDD